jgi:hypothetical protein
MKLLRDKLIDFFKHEDLRKDINIIIKPVSSYIYDEVYIYLCIFCVYHIFQIITIMIIIYMLLKLLHQNNIIHQNKNLINMYNDKK